MIAEAAEVGGVKLVIAEVPGGPNELRQLIDQLRRKAAPVAVLLANRQEEEKKVTLIAGLSRDLVERGLDAVAVGPRGGGGRRWRRRRPARHGPSRRQAARQAPRRAGNRPQRNGKTARRGLGNHPVILIVLSS